MRPFVFRCFLTCIFAIIRTLAGATDFVWPDQPDGRMYKIDLERKTLEVEVKPGQWQPVHAVLLKNVVMTDLPPMTKVAAFASAAQERYLTVTCTNQVYRFSFATYTLERIDRTYYRGYNCGAAQFLRHDTLYSFGGYGFWHTHNILSYYKTGAGSWESLVPATTGPETITHRMSGYIPSIDAYFSAFTYRQNPAPDDQGAGFDPNVYLFSFADRRWISPGRLSKAILTQITDFSEKEISCFWSGRYFLITRSRNSVVDIWIVDPVANTFRVWKDEQKQIDHWPVNTDQKPFRDYVWRDTLYYYQNTENSTTHLRQRSGISLDRIWQEATPGGVFYEPEPNSAKFLYALLGIILLAAAGWLLKRRTVRGRVTPAIPILPNLSPEESNLLNALLNATDTDGLSSEQVNALLGISDKAAENQRRLRADAIRNINTTIQSVFGIEQAVDRIPAAHDRRMFTYQLKLAVKERMREPAPN